MLLNGLMARLAPAKSQVFISNNYFCITYTQHCMVAGGPSQSAQNQTDTEISNIKNRYYMYSG